jgi:tRNA pseudouridine55 synthase
VRAFARDFAATLGTVAHLTALRRTHSGAFTLGDAVHLDGLTREQAVAALQPCELAIARALPCRSLSDDETLWARQGKRFPWPATLGGGAHAWLDPSGSLVAVGEGVDGVSRVTRGFFAAPPKAD